MSQKSQKSQKSQILEGSQAIAQVINLCKPEVVSAYPITPQTHIVEDLAKMDADGVSDFEFVRAESEFSAASIVLGASAAGSRVYTATSSQGLLLMTEVIYNIAGLGLPVVMTCANRAIGAPINIWNDQQDAYSVRDAGWIMLFAKNFQEAVDLHILAYKIAETSLLPVMVNVDGFIITHTIKEVDIPNGSLIKKFLPKIKRENILDVKNPKTFGSLVTPSDYQGMRLELNEKIKNQKSKIKIEMKNFKKIFGRELNIVSEYKTKDADTVFVITGAVYGTVVEAVNLLRKMGKKVGAIHIGLLRPFPDEDIFRALEDKKRIIVLNRAISLGAEGILTTEIKKALYGKCKTKIQDEVVGLGGRDVTVEDIVGLF